MSALDTMLASEAVLAKEWNTPAEDEAWKYLSDKSANTIIVPSEAHISHIAYPGFYVVVPNGTDAKQVVQFLAAMLNSVYAKHFPPSVSAPEPVKRRWWQLW